MLELPKPIMESKLLDIAPMDWVIERRQILTAAVAFCLLFILYSYQRPSTLHFERVGRSWWLQLFPAMLGMKFSVVDSIQAGYDKVCDNPVNGQFLEY